MIRAKWSDKNSYDSASIKTIDFVGYTYRHYKVSGTITITKDIINAPKITTVHADVVLTEGMKKDSSKLNSTVTQELIDEKDTSTVTDNIYQLTGSATGTNSKGDKYTETIDVPLIKDMSCPWFV